MTVRSGALHHPDGEQRWVRDERWSTLARPTTAALLSAYDHLLVVAAHPDDECLGAGAFIADAACLGVDVTVLVLTDGEGSHPRSPTILPPHMGSMRRAEAGRAAAVLAPGARIVHAGLPDGGLPSSHGEAVGAIQDVLRPGTLVIAPWTADGHPDHDVAGRAAAEAVTLASPSRERPVGLAHYVVWLWHWCDPDDLPWANCVVVDATLDGLSKSERALGEHRTQRLRLSPAAGDECLLTPAVLAPSRRGFTTLVLGGVGEPVGDSGDSGDSRPERELSPVAEAEPVGATFDAMFGDGDDPWSSDSWYERRKRGLTLAALGRERYDRVLDLGCSTGVLTTDLAGRADAVVGIDASARALDIAKNGGGQAISWIHGVAPDVLDDIAGPFDLVVLSEVAYFLRPFDLWLTLAALLERLTPGGELLLVNWRHPTKHIPSDGPTAHAQVRSACGWWMTSSHVDPDFLLDAYVFDASAVTK